MKIRGRVNGTRTRATINTKRNNANDLQEARLNEKQGVGGVTWIRGQ